MGRWRQRLDSTRARVLIGALALLAVTMVVSIAVDRAVLMSRLSERIDNELNREVQEFRTLAAGIDPNTGEPFGPDLGALFDTYFSRNVPAKNEVFLAILDGTPYLRSVDAQFPIEELDNLMASWAAGTGPQLRTDDTPAGPLRSLAVPVVTDEGTPRGVFVVARFPEVEQAKVDEAIQVATLVGSLAFVAASLAAWWLAGRVLAPLRQLAETAAEIDEHDLGRRLDGRGSGELAELSGRFNSMLDRVETAFATQRAFLDDAGHELRTPITVLRGHLELVEAGDPLPGDTRDLLLDELDRMSRIVEDLVTMAKSERPDFVTPGPVDVADLTFDIASKARALGQRDWQVSADAVVVADLDRQRLVQAWMNLVRNAAQHTSDGDRIHVFSRERDGLLELGVADSGEGVSDSDRRRIFDRFARGSSARRTKTDGAGLGLAITAAIAEAHHGTVALSDTPGGGATFTIRLPLASDQLSLFTEPEVLPAWPAS